MFGPLVTFSLFTRFFFFFFLMSDERGTNFRSNDKTVFNSRKSLFFFFLSTFLNHDLFFLASTSSGVIFSGY